MSKDVAKLEAAIETLRAGRRERPIDGPDWFRIWKGTASLDGSFTQDELRAIIVLMDSGECYEALDPPFAVDAEVKGG